MITEPINTLSETSTYLLGNIIPTSFHKGERDDIFRVIIKITSLNTNINIPRLATEYTIKMKPKSNEYIIYDRRHIRHGKKWISIKNIDHFLINGLDCYVKDILVGIREGKNIYDSNYIFTIEYDEYQKLIIKEKCNMVTNSLMRL